MHEKDIEQHILHVDLLPMQPGAMKQAHVLHGVGGLHGAKLLEIFNWVVSHGFKTW
jgi:hypothetical protein